MAKIIIKMTEEKHDNPNVNRMRFKPGDVVAVVNDRHKFSYQESREEWIKSGRKPEDWHGKTAIIHVPWFPADALQTLVETEDTDDYGNVLLDESGQPIPHKRRKWRLEVLELDKDILDNLKTKGYAKVHPARLGPHFMHKRKKTRFNRMP